MGWQIHPALVKFCALVVLFVAASFEPVRAAEQPFYAGKTITIVIGAAPGGTGGLRHMTVMKFLHKYLPGNPTIVAQYMEGAGGLAAANHLANVVKRDGLTLGGISSALYSNAILGVAGVRYKLDDFVCLGTPYSGGPHALVVRPGLRLDTVEKLKAHQGLRFAERSVGHGMYIVGRMIAFVLELNQPKWILGYNQREVDLALEREEADALGLTVHSIMREKSAWMEKGYTVPIVLRNPKGRGAEFVPEFPKNLAHLEQYVDTPLKGAAMQFHTAMRPNSSVLFAPKGIPEAALRDLREAFSKIWSDAQFAEEYRRLIQEPMDPITGDEIEKGLAQIPKDPKIMQIYKEITGAGPLPLAR
jgi:tripartite-type tricarboxylate transporter receptor subunit TctC